MKAFEKLLDSLFCEIDGVVMDLQSGSTGVSIKTNDGEQIVSLSKSAAGKPKLVYNPLTDLAFAMPAYAVRTHPDQLKFGDIIVLADDSFAFFHSKVEDAAVDNPVFRVVNAKTGRTSDVTLGHNLLLGNAGVLAVRSFASLGGEGQQFPWWLLLLGDGKLKDNKMLLFMLMQQQGGLNAQPGGMPPWWLLLLGQDGDGDRVKNLMLMQMLQGGQGQVDLSNLMPLLFSLGK